MAEAKTLERAEPLLKFDPYRVAVSSVWTIVGTGLAGLGLVATYRFGDQIAPGVVSKVTQTPFGLPEASLLGWIAAIGVVSAVAGYRFAARRHTRAT